MDNVTVTIPVQVILYEKEMVLQKFVVTEKERISLSRATEILNENEIEFDSVLKIAREKAQYSIPLDSLITFPVEYK